MPHCAACGSPFPDRGRFVSSLRMPGRREEVRVCRLGRECGKPGTRGALLAGRVRVGEREGVTA